MKTIWMDGWMDGLGFIIGMCAFVNLISLAMLVRRCDLIQSNRFEIVAIGL